MRSADRSHVGSTPTHGIECQSLIYTEVIMKYVVAYLKLLWPPAFRNQVNRLRREAYQDGWNNGFDRGHLRGFIAMRNRTKNGNRYQYSPPTPTERT
jgi:hypothetical protein